MGGVKLRLHDAFYLIDLTGLHHYFYEKLSKKYPNLELVRLFPSLTTCFLLLTVKIPCLEHLLRIFMI